jgi:hypothetical protein
MYLNYRRSAQVGKKTRVNISKSGASLSRKVGPFTVNSRGHVTLRLGRGFSLRIL